MLFREYYLKRGFQTYCKCEGALPPLEVVGSVPGKLRMGPHSHGSWPHVSWWDCSQSGKSHTQEMASLSVRSCSKQVSVTPRIWLKQSPSGANRWWLS